ncbi:MAG TPA: hypothetical protein ENN14_01905, partial [Chloroflexi bacterium]|nr:hypothetical protein [Chloroflexota bacterium]
MNSSRLSAFCDRALEVGWLLGITITPVFFNVYSSRVFEPDKLTTLRSLAVIMACLWLARFTDLLLRGEQPLRFSWRTPLVLPALLTMLSYVISTLFSVIPYTSFIGSYQRLQGTYTLFGYLVLFFALLTSLRTRSQLNRLITVLIINSLPVSLYGILQHNGLDPLPWAGNVQTRVASNMGNAIFVAAYLIMILPLTAARIVESFKDILTREEARISDILRASGYIVILVVQLMTIWYSKSRGPWLGLIAGAFLFPYLAFIMLQRHAASQAETKGSVGGDLLQGTGFALGSMALAGALVAVGLFVIPGNYGTYIGGGLGALVFGASWLYMVVERKGWRWLWISWGVVGLAVALVLVAMNLPGPLQDRVRSTPSIRRLATISQLESGTGKVRALIWEGALELISPHDPIEFPDGSTDTFNFLRPLIGYGPESMYVAYNSFYPPELGHYESRTASPDRSHNETLDAVVITGILGLAIYIFLFGNVFYWGFRWLGLLQTRQQFWIYLGMNAFSVLFFTILLWQLEGFYLFGVAVPLGMLVGTVLYLTVEAFRVSARGALALPGNEDAEKRMLHPHTLLLVAILSAVIAYFIEINFGIAIAATRTTFWVLSGLMVVLGLQWIAQPDAEVSTVVSASRASKRARRRKAQRATSAQAWIATVVALSLFAVFILGTLAFDFVNNPSRTDQAGRIFWYSLTRLYDQRAAAYTTESVGALMLFVFTWFLLGMLGLSELENEGLFDKDRGRRWGIAIMIYTLVSIVGVWLFGSALAGLQANLTRIPVASIADAVLVAERLAGVLGLYYILIFGILILMALVLQWEHPQPREEGDLLAWGLLGILLIVGILLIGATNYNLIRADVIFKQGDAFSKSNDPTQKQAAIAHYERALEYVPREDFYYLYLGKTYLELAQVHTEAEQRMAALQRTEEILHQAREINPLNTDHSANLARFYRSM